MKLHWSSRSPYVRKVMVAAHELGLADRIERVRNVAAMGAPNPAIMADNPLSKIPTLVLDDGSVLFDSDVIVEYLDHLGGNRLLPPPGPARWDALARQALGSGLMDVLILWRNEREKPAAQQTEAWLAAFATKTQATLDRLEQDADGLSARPFDVGHIALGCALSYLDFRFDGLRWRDGRPALAAWHDTFRQRPSAQATEAVDA